MKTISNFLTFTYEIVLATLLVFFNVILMAAGLIFVLLLATTFAPVLSIWAIFELIKLTIKR